VSEFLLELLCEEIPARMQLRAAQDLRQLTQTALHEHGLEFTTLEAFVTPRRLVLYGTGLPEYQPERMEERKGPRIDAPEAALAGFLKSTGLTRADLIERSDAKGVATFFAQIKHEGQATLALLSAHLPAIITALPWPKSMRWGEGSRNTQAMRWVRPLQSILCLFNGALVPFECGGIKTTTATWGHRFMGEGAFSVENFADYRRKLSMNKVILDSNERKAHIEQEAQRLAAQAGLTLVDDPALLVENAGLTEWPVVLLGHFNPDFLAVPAECLTATIRANQKYLTLKKPDGSMAPNFLCVANLEASDQGAAIVAGNQKVLSARLYDAQFFWQSDLKYPLAARLPKLDSIVFHEKLGTLAQKTQRIIALAQQLAPSIPRCDVQKAQIAASLCKADLVTQMVGEFPELQGIMGHYYALKDGLDTDIAQALEAHYQPLSALDACPTAPISICIALADKLDTLTSFFSIGEKPTGSKDPFGLRRAALGVIRLIVENGLRLDLKTLFHTQKAVQDQLLAFFIDRLKVQQKEAGVRHDLIDAIVSLGDEEDLVRLLDRVQALEAFITQENGHNLLAGYKRAANILRLEEKKDAQRYDAPVEPGLLGHAAEIRLYETLAGAGATAQAALEIEDFSNAMAALASLRGPVDAFFDHVTVNAEEPHIRANRLCLLSHLRQSMHRVADFSKIEG
jgi:glycyl-tRNA synthetase beta chain